MYRTKKDVDKYVESLSSKLSTKEFKTRAYSVARLYFEVGDYASCQKYVDQYLTQKDNNAAAHKLLGHALDKLGQKEKALEQFKTSLDLDPAQTSLILDICELLADNDVDIDVGRAKYWCEKAEAIFPRHPITFRLREKLISQTNPDPEALIKLLTSELTLRPKDALLHSRLLKHYLETNNIKEAFKHTCDVEFGENPFINNNAWYETVSEILRHNSNDFTSWCYQMLLLTVKERLCVLSLSEVPNGTSKSLIECNEFLHEYDQAIGSVVKTGACSSFAEFHSNLIIHHKGQFAFHAATFMLKKAKKDQLSWRDATKVASPLMIVACQTAPIDPKANWLANAPESQKKAVRRWYLEDSYRCSQSGHYLLTNYRDKSQFFLDQISQSCADTHWKDKLYEKLFMNKLMKSKTSFFISTAFDTPSLQLPRVSDIEVYDSEAQKVHANSLHHFVWMLMNYKNYADFKLTLFNMLMNKGKNLTNCGPETLDKLDVFAFLICATFTSKQQISNKTAFISDYKPIILPANITELLCHLSQIKWWDCAYKFSQNELGSELTDIRVTLSRGIEVVRCIDNHGLDPELLCFLGRVFSEQAKRTSVLHEKNSLELRACLYYSSAIPLLEKLKNRIVLKLPEKRMFDYTHKELTTKNLKSLLGESKLFIAVNYLNEGEYEKAIDMLSGLKSPHAYYHLSETYKKMAIEENFSKDNFDDGSKLKYATLLLKAKKIVYKALESMNDAGLDKNQPLYSDIQESIEDLEARIHRIHPDSLENINNYDGRYSSDDNISYAGREHAPQRMNSNVFTSMSSTPKVSKANVTNYRTAIDSQVLESPRDDQFLERIENQIKKLQKRDNTIDTFMEQTKDWFEENRKLGSQIINTIQSNMQQTTDQFKLLKISVDQVKDQIDECRNECKDVGELKKQVAELKKEVNKLKKTPSEQTNETEIYNLQDEYRGNENTASFAAQLPYTQSQVPQFNQRLVPPFPVPPNPYQFYGQNFYNLYNQYSQLFQPSTLPGAQPLFDANRPQVNYPGVFPTSDQMHLDVAHLAPPAATTIPVASKLAPVSKPPQSMSVNTTKSLSTEKSKDSSRSLPVNVVITSSDPLPTCTTAPTPILSVTIPPQHIKGTPHNYQIQMPSTTDTKVIPPPLFSFPTPGSKIEPTVTGSTVNWNRSTVFQSPTNSLESNVLTTSFGESLDKNVVDGINVSSPNTSLNKSRTLSERSNTSIENYDPCPDFKPIIPLPDEVKVTTGEEDETVIFSSRAVLFRFIDKQWKERGLGEIKLLKHNVTGKVRVLMRREKVHKICANHIITSEMEIKPMKNETKAYFWVANDFADETVVLEKFCIRFKTADIATEFYKSFEKARQESMPSNIVLTSEKDPSVFSSSSISKESTISSTTTQVVKPEKTVIGGFTFSSMPAFKPTTENVKKESVKSTEPATAKVNIFSNLTFKSSTDSPFSKIFSTSESCTTETANPSHVEDVTQKLNNSDTVEEFEPNIEFKPVVPLPALVDHRTGEEDEIVLFEHRAKLLRFEAPAKEWKERGLGNIKLLVHKDNNQKLRLLMRREQVMKVCCNHTVTKEMTFQKMSNLEKAVTWCAQDFSDGELIPETFCLRFKTAATCTDFIESVKTAQSKMKDDSKAAKEEQNAAKQGSQVNFGDKFKPKPGSWCCEMCYTNNLENFLKCACCENPKPQIEKSKFEHTATNSWGDKFKPKPGSWECKDCLVRNDNEVEYCSACGSPKDPSISKKETKNLSENLPKFNFGIPAQTSSNIPKSKENIIPTMVSGSTVTGWGDKFKPKEGSWECSQCFVRNESNAEQCSACNNLKDLNSVPQEKKSIFENEKTKDENTATNSWGDKFKLRPSSWECKNCLVRNENDVECCSACGNPKDSSISKKETIKTSGNLPKFSFGIPAQTSSNIKKTEENVVSTMVSGPIVPGWGDKFKSKEGSWECSQCFVRNESNVEQCSACNNSKEKKTVLDNISSGQKFNFGIPSTIDSQKPKQSDASSIFDGTGVHKFSFGVTTLDNIQESKETVSLQKPALLPTPQKVPLTTTFSGKGGTFDFVFKPKTPPKGKSPMKSPKSEKGNDSDDGNEYASEDEGHHIHFSPIIPLPDKVEVVTGEENEDEIYGHRAKLFRFMSGEWKERGIGVVKILRHKDTGKLRVVMRREQVLKICLNHCLTSEIIYTPKDDKTWLFAANDFSEGELSLQQFCLRFKTKEIAIEFKNSIDKARDGKTVVKTTTDDKLEDIDDVVFVKEIQATDEEKKKAKELLLPENFFTYQNKEPCLGCRGCKDDNEDNNCTTKTSAAITTSQTETYSVSTPVKNLTSFFQSPTNSIYGTPANFNKSADTSVFRTPFESLISNGKSTSQTSSNLFNSSSEMNEPNKENTLIQSPSIFTSTSEQNSAIGTRVKTSANSGSEECKTPVSSKNYILAAPKLSNVNSNIAVEKPDTKSVFGLQGKSLFGESKPAFGVSNFGTSINKSIFGFSTDTIDPKQANVKSLFGGDNDHKPVNLFSGSQQGSMFGPGALQGDEPKTDSSALSSVLSSTNSASGNELQPKWPFQINKPNDETAATKDENFKKDAEPVEKDTLFQVDSSLTFASLSSSEPGFAVQKKHDFRWEGAGQQLFTSAQKALDMSSKSKNDSGTANESDTAGGGDEEYDPHYEPIVPLPDKIVVTTGEEDEQKLFGERCKLYRYDEQAREWKERGVGEMKVLYHPEKKSYRLLLRREQIHKAVLNMLLFADLELLSMKNSDRAWTWACRNHAESAAGEQETLAVRFKSVELATAFRDKVVECVRKLQAAAAQAIREVKESNKDPVAPLRLPKHLEGSARVDARGGEQPPAPGPGPASVPAGPAPAGSEQRSGDGAVTELFKQVHFQEPQDEDSGRFYVDHDHYEQEYGEHDEYDAYYHDNEDESSVYYTCDGAVSVVAGGAESSCPEARVHVMFDQDICSPKIMVTDNNTGEILADMLIYTETQFEISEDTCSWSGTDYTTNEPVEKTVTVHFADSEVAMRFYDSCETSKAAAYSCTDPES